MVDCERVQSFDLSNNTGQRIEASEELDNPCSLARECSHGHIFVGECNSSLHRDSILVLDSSNLLIESSFGAGVLIEVTELCLVPHDCILTCATDTEGATQLFMYTELGELLRRFSLGCGASSACYVNGMLYLLPMAEHENAPANSVVAVQVQYDSVSVVQTLVLHEDLDLVDACIDRGIDDSQLLVVDYSKGLVRGLSFL